MGYIGLWLFGLLMATCVISSGWGCEFDWVGTIMLLAASVQIICPSIIIHNLRKYNKCGAIFSIVFSAINALAGISLAFIGLAFMAVVAVYWILIFAFSIVYLRKINKANQTKSNLEQDIMISTLA